MRVLIAEPNALVEEGLAQVVRTVAPRASVDRAGKRDLLARAAFGASPAVAIVAHPWISLATVRALRLRHPDLAIVVVTGDADAGVHHRLLAGHVAAALPQSSPPDIVAATLRIVLSGDVSVHGRALREAVTAKAPRARARIAALNLTPRQLDVLALVANGRSNQAIAAELGLGLRTVKGHVAVILRALHSDNRRDAGRVARRWLKRVTVPPGTGPSTTATGIG